MGKSKKNVEIVEDVVDSIESFMLFDKESQTYEYDIKVKVMKSSNTVYEILRSNAEHWQVHSQGELLFSIVDNNTTIIINGLSDELDYSLAHELRVLLTFMEKSSANMINYNVLREDVHMTL